nr:NAD-dependent deacylase [Salipaludibacillus daqingensis]
MAWADRCFPDVNSNIVFAANWIQTAGSTVVLTGAGMSTESNIPDFRSSSGWWKQIDPRTVATTEALAGNYPLFQEFYARRIEALKDIDPHEGHRVLASWEQLNLIDVIGTQNVDGLHAAAGSNNVHELHGSIDKIRCDDCDMPAEKIAFVENEACFQCNGKLRPNVVLFGEMLPQKAWTKTLEAIEKADLVIVIGTSLEVYPVNQLPNMTSGRTIYINAEISDVTHRFDIVIEGMAKLTLMEINELVLRSA